MCPFRARNSSSDSCLYRFLRHFSGGVITAFVGGLPRAQHAEKHTISVLGGVEEHVCFQFGSPVRDFVVLPSKLQKSVCRNEENEESSKQSMSTF